MQWGSQIEYLEKIREDMGVMPQALLNRPTLHELGVDTYGAFQILNRGRSTSMAGLEAISVGALRDYCHLFYIEHIDERDHFVRMMQRLDQAYLAAIAARSDKKTESAKEGS